MNNLSVKIDNLYYSTVEREISNFYGLGMINSSTLPIQLQEDEEGTYYITGTRKHGDFHIRITKQPDGKYWLFVSPYNLNKHR
jgi:hypothetical protein